MNILSLAVYESQQGVSSVGTAAPPPTAVEDDNIDWVAPELEDLEAFGVSPVGGRAFGAGGATITQVSLRDTRGSRVTVLTYHQRVVLTILAVTRRELLAPIIGFTVRDRLGQDLFAENTFAWTRTTSLSVAPDEVLEARFEFVLPRLPPGDYTISVAVAEGTQLDHVQHHWVHDALAVTSQPDQLCLGLVGLDVREASLRSRGRVPGTTSPKPVISARAME